MARIFQSPLRVLTEVDTVVVTYWYRSPGATHAHIPPAHVHRAAAGRQALHQGCRHASRVWMATFDVLQTCGRRDASWWSCSRCGPRSKATSLVAVSRTLRRRSRAGTEKETSAYHYDQLCKIFRGQGMPSNKEQHEWKDFARLPFFERLKNEPDYSSVVFVPHDSCNASLSCTAARRPARLAWSPSSSATSPMPTRWRWHAPLPVCSPVTPSRSRSCCGTTPPNACMPAPRSTTATSAKHRSRAASAQLPSSALVMRDSIFLDEKLEYLARGEAKAAAAGSQSIAPVSVAARPAPVKTRADEQLQAGSAKRTPPPG